MTNNICHGKVTARPTVVQCTRNYESVKRNHYKVCVDEAKNNFPNKSMREIIKLKDNSGKLIIKNASRGCTKCCSVHRTLKHLSILISINIK